MRVFAISCPALCTVVEELNFPRRIRCQWLWCGVVDLDGFRQSVSLLFFRIYDRLTLLLQAASTCLGIPFIVAIYSSWWSLVETGSFWICSRLLSWYYLTTNPAVWRTPLKVCILLSVPRDQVSFTRLVYLNPQFL